MSGQSAVDRHHLELHEKLKGAHDALCCIQILTDWARQFGVHSCTYGIVPSLKLSKKPGGISVRTTPYELHKAWYRAGGFLTDPFAKKFFSSCRPIILDFRAVNGNKALSAQVRNHPFIVAGIDLNLDLAHQARLAGPMGDAVALLKFNADIMPERDRYRLVMDEDRLLEGAGYIFHHHVHQYRALASLVPLTVRERDALAFLAAGKVADDIADRWSVGRRVVEKHLDTARKKLKARTSTEAVYKATVYGIF
jgi:DNA-binding CsgD family transcriptional regulator